MDKPPPTPTELKAAKEARLAAALRTNLRRRKTAGRAAASNLRQKDEPS